MFKKIVSYFFTFILIIQLIITSGVLIAQSTVLDKKYVLKVLEETDYYAKTKENVQNAFGNYILQSGLDEKVIDNLFEDTKLREDIDNVINCLYDNTALNVETKSIEEKLQSRIDEVLKEHNKRLDRDEEKAIEKFVTAIKEAYVSEVAYSTSIVTKVANVLNNQIKPLISVGAITAVASLVVIVLIMLIINRSKVLSYFGISLFAAGGLITLVPIGVRVSVNIDTLLMLNSSFSEMIIKLISSTLGVTLVSGIIMLVIGIAVLVMSSVFEGKERPKSKGRRKK